MKMRVGWLGVLQMIALKNKSIIVILGILFSGSLIGNLWYLQAFNKANTLIDTQDSEILTLNNQVLNLTYQIDNLTETIILLEDEVLNTTNEINDLNIQISELESQIDNYNLQITDLNNYIDYIEEPNLDGRVDLHTFDQIETILEGGSIIWNYGIKTAYNVKVKIYLYSGETEIYSKTFNIGTVKGRTWINFNFTFGFEGQWDNWGFSIIY